MDRSENAKYSRYLSINSVTESSFYFTVSIYNTIGKCVKVKVNSSCKVRDLKQHACWLLHEPMGFSRLFYNGWELENKQALEDVGVTYSVTMNIQWRPTIATQARLYEELEKEKMMPTMLLMN